MSQDDHVLTGAAYRRVFLRHTYSLKGLHHHSVTLRFPTSDRTSQIKDFISVREVRGQLPF